MVQALLLVLHKAKPDACERLVARIISKSRSSDELDTDRVRAQLITDQVRRGGPCVYMFHVSRFVNAQHSYRRLVVT